MNDQSLAVLGPLLTLQNEAEKIAGEHAFNQLDFRITAKDTDGLPHATLVLEWDPEKVSVPDVVIVQASQALDEEQERSYQAKLEQDAEEAKKELQEDLGLKDKLRKPGEGFL